MGWNNLVEKNQKNLLCLLDRKFLMGDPKVGIQFKVNNHFTMDCGIRHNDDIFDTYIY
jgi:hypothetical protein